MTKNIYLAFLKSYKNNEAKHKKQMLKNL